MEKAELYKKWIEEEKAQIKDWDFSHIRGRYIEEEKFFDVGALVWFAKIIEWEFINFSVNTHLDNLYKAQKLLEKNGVIEGKTHRFYFVARKKR